MSQWEKTSRREKDFLYGVIVGSMLTMAVWLFFLI